MTWLQALDHLADGRATLVILGPDEVERLRADLGPVEIMSVEFRFERGGVNRVTVTRANGNEPASDGLAAP